MNCFCLFLNLSVLKLSKSIIKFMTKSYINLMNRWLVRRGANVNAVSNWGQIPIHCAVESSVDEDGVNIAYLVRTGK